MEGDGIYYNHSVGLLPGAGLRLIALRSSHIDCEH